LTFLLAKESLDVGSLAEPASWCQAQSLRPGSRFVATRRCPAEGRRSAIQSWGALKTVVDDDHVHRRGVDRNLVPSVVDVLNAGDVSAALLRRNRSSDRDRQETEIRSATQQQGREHGSFSLSDRLIMEVEETVRQSQDSPRPGVSFSKALGAIGSSRLLPRRGWSSAHRRQRRCGGRIVDPS